MEEGYDLAVRIARLPSSSLISRRLASTRMVLCASPRYLAEVLPQYRGAVRGVYAVYPSRQHVAPKVRLMIDFLVQAFRAPPWGD